MRLQVAPALPSKTPTHPASLLALDAALQQRLFRVPSQTLYSSPGGQSLSRRPAKRVAQAQTGLQQGLVPVCSSSQPEPLSLPEGKLCVTGSPAPVPGPRTRGSTGASRAPVQLLAVASPRALASTRYQQLCPACRQAESMPSCAGCTSLCLITVSEAHFPVSISFRHA